MRRLVLALTLTLAGCGSGFRNISDDACEAIARADTNMAILRRALDENQVTELKVWYATDDVSDMIIRLHDICYEDDSK